MRKQSHTRTLIHASDLHIGKSPEVERRAIAIRDAVLASAADHLVVTGDLTHRGRTTELATFWRIFAPLVTVDRLTVVPGNHDRLGDDVADAIHGGARVAITRTPGLHLVRFDSTGPHNRAWLAGHGAMSHDDVAAIAEAVGGAAPGDMVAVLLHHHVLPLPPDHAAERLVSWLGWPYAEELERGRALLVALRGRCDLVLHGHRHTPQGATLHQDGARPLSVFNAGSSTELGRVRAFCHRDGVLTGPPAWLETWAGPVNVSTPRARGGSPLRPQMFAAPPA